MADVEIAITYDSLDFIVNANSGVPSFKKGDTFDIEVTQWANNSKIRRVDLSDFVPFEFDPISKDWVVNTQTEWYWSTLNMTIQRNQGPSGYWVLPAYPGGGAHNIIKFTIRLTFNNGKTFRIDPILDERPT